MLLNYKLSIFFIFWVFFVFLYYIRTYPVTSLFRNFFEIFVFFLLMINVTTFGKKILNYFKVNAYITKIEEYIFSFAIGIVVFTYLAIILGLCKMLRAETIFIFLCITVIVSVKEIKILLLELLQLPKIIYKRVAFNSYLIFGILLFMLYFFIIVGTLAPVTFYDSLVYHLALPDIFIRHKGIIPIPYNTYFNYPLNIEMLFTILKLIYNDILTQLLHCLFGVLCGVTIFLIGKRVFSFLTGILGALIFYTIPKVMVLSIQPMVDLGLLFYILVSFLSLVKAFKEKNTYLLLLSAIFCGYALGVKYNAFYSLVIFNIFIIIDFSLTRKIHIKNILLFNFISLLFYIFPWGIKNFIFINRAMGYPVNSFVHSTISTTKKIFSLKGFLNLFLLPWNITMDELRFGGGLTGPLFLMFTPLIVFFKRKIKDFFIGEKKYIWLFVFIFFIFWYFSPPAKKSVRLLLPTFAFFSLITANIIEKVEEENLIPKLLLKFVLVFVFFLNIFHFAYREIKYVNPFKVVFGLEYPNIYLSRLIPHFVIYSFLNSISDKDTRILSFSEQGSYYCKNDMYIVPFLGGFINELRRNVYNNKDLKRRLADFNIKFILYDRNFYIRPFLNAISQVFRISEKEAEEFKHIYLIEKAKYKNFVLFEVKQ